MQQYIITRLVVTMPPFVMAGPLVWDNQSDTANTSQWYITTLERSKELDLALKTLTRQSIFHSNGKNKKYWSIKESWAAEKIGFKTRQVWTVQMNGRQHSKRSHCFGAKFSSFQGKRIYETNTSIDNQRLWCAMFPVSLFKYWPLLMDALLWPLCPVSIMIIWWPRHTQTLMMLPPLCSELS